MTGLWIVAIYLSKSTLSNEKIGLEPVHFSLWMWNLAIRKIMYYVQFPYILFWEVKQCKESSFKTKSHLQNKTGLKKSDQKVLSLPKKNAFTRIHFTVWLIYFLKALVAKHLIISVLLYWSLCLDSLMSHYITAVDSVALRNAQYHNCMSIVLCGLHVFIIQISQ